MNNDFTDEELEGDIDADFTPDISEKEALAEVERAKRQVNISKQRDEAFNRMRRYQDNPVKLWQEAYRWLMESNPDARKDVEAIVEECRQLRETSYNKYSRSRDIQMRHGMRIPSIVLTTLTLVDPRIKEMEVLDPQEAKRVYRQLEEAFPQFRIPKTN